MRDLVEFPARALVENPDAVEVTEVEENGDLVVEVTVGGDDLGRLIGKGGRVANAIRTAAALAIARIALATRPPLPITRPRSSSATVIS